jgi:hypothetical protein
MGQDTEICNSYLNRNLNPARMITIKNRIMIKIELKQLESAIVLRKMDACSKPMEPFFAR